MLRVLPLLLLLLLPLLCVAAPSLYPAPPEESRGREYWLNQGQREIDRVIKETQNLRPEKRAKHVVLFVGDGMGVTTVTAARIFKGQLENSSGDEAQLSFELFPYTGLAKTYNTDHQTADSAGTATAFLTGVKTRSGLLGVSGAALRGNCSTVTDETRLKTFLRMAADEGRAVGLVTTTSLTHATPAAAYSHTVERSWEIKGKSNCPDIATQLVSNAADYKVIFGGGRDNFLPNLTGIANTTEGKRLDNTDLVKKWTEKQKGSTNCSRSAYVKTRDELLGLQADKVDCVLGLLARSHLEFHAENLANSNASTRQPSLAEMTTKALELLTVYGKDKGLVLLVEGGRIDHGHHGNQANRALSETVALSEAVEAAVQLLKKKNILDETLMIVTADHSHVFTLGHYAMRGQPITQLKYKRDDKTGQLTPDLLTDGLPLTVANYADGRSANNTRKHRWEKNSAADDTTRPNYEFPAMMQSKGESHGGEDVPVYARGPGAHLVQGVHEQTHVAHVIMYSARLGAYANSASPEIGTKWLNSVAGAAIFSAAYVIKSAAALIGTV